MRVAVADPPYLGCCGLYGHEHGSEGRPFDGGCWDDPETHRALIGWLGDEFPDGWALCASSPSPRTLLPMVPESVRVMVWVKPFASYKPNVNPAYAWEPVLVKDGRRLTREQLTVRDWVSCPITLKRGLTGVKPDGFCEWLFQVLNLEPHDELVDVFPGSGAVGAAWGRWRSQLRIAA